GAVRRTGRPARAGGRAGRLRAGGAAAPRPGRRAGGPGGVTGKAASSKDRVGRGPALSVTRSPLLSVLISGPAFLGLLASEPGAEGEQQVDVLHVAVGAGVQQVGPGVAVLHAEAGVEDAAAAGELHVGVGRHEGAVDHVGAVADL